ncbi:UNVERIFIED_CONTAM: hypothetical protein Sradi_6229300 [Sesamum radiatum]|uniref:Uncharacterized protein n=1 Tax=Sesamum radiatum TaxID=300843 RepID=A0AAW2KAV9_SESRA
MCALLVALGLAEDWKNAEKLIKEKRPYIRLNGLHRKALEEWSKHQLSPPKRNGQSGNDLPLVLSNGETQFGKLVSLPLVRKCSSLSSIVCFAIDVHRLTDFNCVELPSIDFC